MFKKIEKLLRRIVWEETQDASRHFHKQGVDRTDDLVQLVLDLHDKKWSYKSDAFLRTLNIDPTPYWDKYRKKGKK